MCYTCIYHCTNTLRKVDYCILPCIFNYSNFIRCLLAQLKVVKLLLSRLVLLGCLGLLVCHLYWEVVLQMDQSCHRNVPRWLQLEKSFLNTFLQMKCSWRVNVSKVDDRFLVLKWRSCVENRDQLFSFVYLSSIAKNNWNRQYFKHSFSFLFSTFLPFFFPLPFTLFSPFLDGGTLPLLLFTLGSSHNAIDIAAECNMYVHTNI